MMIQIPAIYFIFFFTIIYRTEKIRFYDIYSFVLIVEADPELGFSINYNLLWQYYKKRTCTLTIILYLDPIMATDNFDNTICAFQF